jgi:hypothetical protein
MRLIVAAACLILSGCISSNRPLFGSGTAIAPLPANVIAIGESKENADRITAKRDGNSKRYKIDHVLLSKMAVTFHPVPSLRGTYIAQGVNKDQKYLYFVVRVGSRTFSYVSQGYIKSLVKRGQVSGITQSKKKGLYAQDKQSLFRLAKIAAKSGSRAFSARYKTYNLNNASQSAQAKRRNAEIALAEKRNKEKRAIAKAQPKPKPKKKIASAGKWVAKTEVDKITDEEKQFVFGVPSQSEGVQKRPYLRIGCYRKDMGATLYWGTVLEDLYPSGEMDAVRVIVRFGKMDPLYLGWAVSNDFTATFAPGPAAALTNFSDSLLSAIVPGRKPVNFAWNASTLNDVMRTASDAGLDMIVRADNRSGTSSTLVFDLAGYSKLTRSNFRRHCLTPKKRKKR